MRSTKLRTEKRKLLAATQVFNTHKEVCQNRACIFTNDKNAHLTCVLYNINLRGTIIVPCVSVNSKEKSLFFALLTETNRRKMKRIRKFYLVAVNEKSKAPIPHTT